MGFSKSCSKREVHSNTIIPQEIGKALSRRSNYSSKVAGKIRAKKKKKKKTPQSEQKERNHKDQSRNK